MARGTSIIVPLVLALLASSALAQQQVRRVRVRTRPLAAPISAEEPQAEARALEAAPQVQYYAVAPQEEAEEPEALIVVQQPRHRANNYFGNQVSSRQDEQEYRAPLRPQARATSAQAPRQKEANRAPPVQTLRNYNTINDDGSFTFGYEAADGSFKEETRGTDCVVRGKYGYVDPDGNKREFTYVSGNPCDPNNPDPDEDERELEEEDSEENVPVRPNRPIARPVPTTRTHHQRPAPTHAPTQVFQNNYVHGERIQAKAQQQYVPQQVPITPRPVTHLRATEQPATTYRPQIQNYPAVTTPRTIVQPQPQLFYTSAPVQPTARRPALQPTTASSIDFDAELKKFQLEAGAPTLRPTTVSIKSRPVTQNSIAPTTHFAPRPTVPSQPLHTASQRPAGSPNQFYSSQLVFDPASGQYNTVLYQNLPKGGGDFSTNHRLQAFVQPQQHHQQQSVYLNPQQSFQPAFAHRPVASAAQQSPAATPAPQYHTPAPQFAQQQYAPRPGVPAHNPAQSFYYINPNLRNQYSTGQIDDFLRGHNIQF